MHRVDVLLARPEIARLARALAARPGRQIEAAPETRWAAIALILRPSDLGEPELLMIKRAEFEEDPWSGHIACPGGRMDPTDRDLLYTATREVWEETGIEIARHGRVLGTLDDITPRTSTLPPLVIRPFVAAVRPDVEIVESPEVAAAFWVPLDALRERAAWGTGLVHIRGVGEREVEVFRHGDDTVWGLTHRALSQFLQLMQTEE